LTENLPDFKEGSGADSFHALSVSDIKAILGRGEETGKNE